MFFTVHASPEFFTGRPTILICYSEFNVPSMDYIRRAADEQNYSFAGASKHESYRDALNYVRNSPIYTRYDELTRDQAVSVQAFYLKEMVNTFVRF